MDKQTFIKTYYPAAVAGCDGSHIFPLLAIAESAVESGWGESYLTKNANNFFGVKSTPSWEQGGGEFVTMATREVVDGHSVMIQAKFRKYDDPSRSYADYVGFVSGPRYVNAGVMAATTPQEQIQAIAKAGYATDPNYAHLICQIIAELEPLIPENA